MNLPTQIAKSLRAVYFGGNWTDVNLKDTLADVSWQQASAQVFNLNSIVTLVYHTHFYINAVSKVLQNEPLTGTDKDSFVHPPLNSQEEWEALLNKVWTEAESFAKQIEELPESKLDETFVLEKYGNVYRNLQGIVEHLHYHLGQIVLIKKLLAESSK